MNTATPPDMHHISFYKFVAVADPAACADALRAICSDLLGTILIAGEGINGMLAGSAELLDKFETQITQSPVFNNYFSDLQFKRSPCKTQPFNRVKVYLRSEVLPLGIDGVDALDQRAEDLALHLDPQEWRELIAQDDVILIDNRNSFEYRLGHFNNAVDPLVNNFRDFPRYVEEHIDEWKAEGKRVAMYCTGGIRCEKTGVWMRDLGLPIYQLKGGILNFFAEMPDADRDWQGECFVFDNRIAIDTKLQETDTTAEQVYAGDPDEQWRLRRAKRLDAAALADQGKETTNSEAQ